MEKVFDNELGKMSQNQLAVLKCLLAQSERVWTTYVIAKKTGVVEKQLGGVLSALSRKRVAGTGLMVPMGRDARQGRRWKLNSKALTLSLADKRVKALLSSYK